MRRTSLLFLPAGLAAVADLLTTRIVLAHQPDYPGRLVAFQIGMLGAALMAVIPRVWMRVVGFVLLAGGVLISGFSVGIFYIPAAIAAVSVIGRGRSLNKRDR
jgi:hypothetical protein